MALLGAWWSMSIQLSKSLSPAAAAASFCLWSKALLQREIMPVSLGGVCPISLCNSASNPVHAILTFEASALVGKVCCKGEMV